MYGFVELARSVDILGLCGVLAAHHDSEYDLKVLQDDFNLYKWTKSNSLNFNEYYLTVKPNELLFRFMVPGKCGRFSIAVTQINDLPRTAWELPLKLTSKPPCLIKDPSASGRQLIQCPDSPWLRVSSLEDCSSVSHFVESDASLLEMIDSNQVGQIGKHDGK